MRSERSEAIEVSIDNVVDAASTCGAMARRELGIAIADGVALPTCVMVKREGQNR